ncbi:hypothetical protein HAX54_007957, partial [Datura stramonium]|nr:hypothetical protein [Datura stramonium]
AALFCVDCYVLKALERFFIDLVAGESLIKERAAAQSKPSLSGHDILLMLIEEFDGPLGTCLPIENFYSSLHARGARSIRRLVRLIIHF